MKTNVTTTILLWISFCATITAQDFTSCSARLDSVITIDDKGTAKETFRYHEDSLTVEINRYDKQPEGWNLKAVDKRTLDKSARTIRSEKLSYLKDGERERWEEDYVFDPRGHNIQRKWLAHEGEKEKERGNSVRTYDEDGHLLYIQNRSVLGEKTAFWRDYSYTYNEMGEMSSKVEKMWDGKFWNLHSVLEWIYNDDGQKKYLYVFRKNNDGLLLVEKLSYFYDRKRRLKEVVYESDWEKTQGVYRKSSFFYDSSGSVVREVKYEARDKKVEKVSVVKFLYDKEKSRDVFGFKYTENPYNIYHMDHFPSGRFRLIEKVELGTEGWKTINKYYYSHKK